MQMRMRTALSLFSQNRRDRFGQKYLEAFVSATDLHFQTQLTKENEENNNPLRFDSSTQGRIRPNNLEG
jgi:hypothetical protein